MNALTSYRVDENLSGIHSVYLYETPDKLRLSILYGGGSQDSLWVGHRHWKRSGHHPWKLDSSNGVKPPVPYFLWDPFAPLQDVHVVGTDSIKGRTATVITFFGGHGDDPEPVWFKLWIARDHTVLQSRMFAPGHFMFDDYRALDRAGGISAPSS